jgi:ubiquinone biosynthesis protein COQ9
MISAMTTAHEPIDRPLLATLAQATLAHVAFDGWSEKAMAAGARDAGIDPDRLSVLFPGGLRDLAAAFSGWADQAMLTALDADGIVLSDLRVRDRIEALAFARFAVLMPHREAVRAVLGFLALPQNVDLGLRLAARTVDTTWRAAGDTATDFSFYTKRGLLASVLAATTLYWLDDRSEGGEATRRFLRARIANVIALQGLRGQCQRLAGGLPDPVRFWRGFAEAFGRARPSWRG